LLRICLDLNVWCGAFISARLGRTDTAAFILTNAARSGASERGPLALVISWGMLARLRGVVVDQLGFSLADAGRLTELIAAYAREGPSLTLGGVGVLPIHDAEDRHVLETAWAGAADLLVTHNLSDFVVPEAEALVPDRIYGLRRGSAKLVVCHTYNAAAWLQGEDWPDAVATFLSLTT
jgi:hypothetical protein